jgi:hypothetical protein
MIYYNQKPQRMQAIESLIEHKLGLHRSCPERSNSWLTYYRQRTSYLFPRRPPRGWSFTTSLADHWMSKEGTVGNAQACARITLMTWVTSSIYEIHVIHAARVEAVYLPLEEERCTASSMNHLPESMLGGGEGQGTHDCCTLVIARPSNPLSVMLSGDGLLHRSPQASVPQPKWKPGMDAVIDIMRAVTRYIKGGSHIINLCVDIAKLLTTSQHPFPSTYNRSTSSSFAMRLSWETWRGWRLTSFPDSRNCSAIAKLDEERRTGTKEDIDRKFALHYDSSPTLWS